MYDVIIIGSGPAGYTAAIYTSRALLSTLIIAGPQPGGQLTTTTEVENYPGFVEGIDGNQLLSDMRKQAERFGTKIKLSNCQIVKLSERKTFLVAASQEEAEARAIIIAVGASARKLWIPSEEKFRGKGVSYCATCDGFFYKDKEVVVVGGGDTAIEEAMFLTRFAKHVTIIHRREGFRASAVMLERARKNPKIVFLTNRVVEEIYGDTVVRGVKIRDTSDGSDKTDTFEDLKTDGVFVAVGHTPNTEFLKGFIEVDAKGYIKISQKYKDMQTMTSVEGIFAAGDCADPRYRQAIVAAGTGCMAALDAERWLADQ